MTNWYGQVRHSKRFCPTYCSVVGSPGGTGETRSMLLHVGQTGDVSEGTQRDARGRIVTVVWRRFDMGVGGDLGGGREGLQSNMVGVKV